MANPFSAPTLTGFNASPPADDGSQTTPNQLGWDKHLDKLATPLKNYSDDLVTNVNLAFATVDDASNLTTGELPDARLSSNIPRKNAANTFTGSPLNVSNAIPTIRLTDSDAAADAKIWQWSASGSNELFLLTRADDGSAGDSPIALTRSGTNVTELALAATSITANGGEVATAETKVKNTDTSRDSTTTLTNDPDLSAVSLEAGTAYAVEGYLDPFSLSATPDFKFALSFDETPQGGRLSFFSMSNSGLGGANTEGGIMDIDAVQQISLTGNDDMGVHLRGHLLTHASNPTTVDLQWAQNNSDAAATVLQQGSWIRFQKL